MILLDDHIPHSNVVSAPQYRSFKSTFGLANIALGLMSAFYHASLTFVGQWCDVVLSLLSSLLYSFSPLHQESMFLVVLCMIMYEMVRAKLVDMKGFLLGYIVLLAITGTNI